jgi:16S rRNA (adenine1518-N6/adenine1519-N6)-dimethyltransferase
MPNLAMPQNTIAILQKYDFHFRKSLGQNFLVDPHILTKIIESANLSREDFVLEIGPGIGTLTQYLAEYAGHVAAVEIDKLLIPILGETLSTYDNVTIIHGDILKLDLPTFLLEQSKGRPIKIVANLPYYITTPILMTLLESRIPLSGITIMIQEEVARRIQATPGSKEYGALSLAVQYYAIPKITAKVPPNCFIPRPTVGSTVLHLNCLPHPSVIVEDEPLLFALIRASFNQRRKTLLNSLSNAPTLIYTKDQIRDALLKLHLPETIRGETLSLSQFAALTQALTITPL